MKEKDNGRKESTDKRKRDRKENPMGMYRGPNRNGRFLYEPSKRSRRVDEEMEIKERIGFSIYGKSRDSENEVFTLEYGGGDPFSNLVSVSSDPDLDFEESKDLFREIYPEAFRIVRTGNDQKEVEMPRERIMVGISLNNLVEKSKGEDWEGIQSFCESLGINYQYAQRLMAIASYDDAMTLADLGIEKLNILVSHLKESGFPGGIWEFIETRNFDFDHPREISLEEFEIQIARAAMDYLNERKRWKVPDELLNRYTDMKRGKIPYSRLLREMDFIRQYGGLSSKYFEVQIQKSMKEFELKDVFDTFVQSYWRLREAVEKWNDPDIADVIGVTSLDTLIRELGELKQQIEENQRKQDENDLYGENMEDDYEE